MVRKTAAAALIMLIFSLVLFSGCRDMETETMLISPESYEIHALVNDSPIEDCSMIRSGDIIRPLFTDSVVFDPDLDGLMVYMLDHWGERSGESALYRRSNQKKSEKNAESASLFDDTAVFFPVSSLNQELPPFPLPENLEIGPYTLVFEGLGGKRVLSRSSTDIFYLGDCVFSLDDISMSLPGDVDSRLVPPETTVKLDAKINFDRRLEPYFYWYNGRDIITEGKASDGAGSVLWKTPDEAGFYSLRLEAFPFQLNCDMAGVSHGLTLPVSGKASDIGFFFGEAPGYAGKTPLSAGTSFFEQLPFLKTAAATVETGTAPAAEPEDLPSPLLFEPPELLHLYQFKGDLFDATAAGDAERALIPGGGDSLWTEAGLGYGFSTGGDSSCILSPVNFFQNVRDEGGGVFLLHFKPPDRGTVFSAFFPFVSSERGVRMDLVTEDSTVVLRLNDGTGGVEMPVPLTSPDPGALVSAAVEFYIRPSHIDAKLSLGGESSPESEIKSLPLPAALAGEGRVSLGGAVWDEFAVLSLQPEKKEAGVQFFSDTGPTAPVEAATVPPAETVIKVDVQLEYRKKAAD